MTGAIFADLANVATGNESPCSRDMDVKAFEDTWVAPVTAKRSSGKPRVL